MTIRIITLGCSKNLVDSEHLLAQFRAAGHRVLHDHAPGNEEAVVINTCGFILDAKEESLDTILHYIREKQEGRLRKVFVMGCLTERYRHELRTELPEVDGIFGVWDWPEILEAFGNRLNEALLTSRVVTTPAHYAFLKISEGCNRSCSFCAIPHIRGEQRSIPIGKLVEEAALLVQGGVKELILIAQDLTNYGIDQYRKRALADLLKQLVAVPGLEWIRLHYAYPTGFPEEVIKLMAAEEKICNYMDIPIQHINDRLLKAMGRGHTRQKLETLLHKFRLRVPDIALRTTLMTGFPGETEESFRELMDFVAGFRFDRVGVFPYSHEDGTPAFLQLKDEIPEKVKIRRAEELMELQQGISLELNEQKVGKIYKVLIDRKEGEYLVGRTQYDSPEVDNEILLPDNGSMKTGEFYQVRITSAEAFDLYGKVEEPTL
jgi:ribosomal protein S12 methylthiotransferase